MILVRLVFQAKFNKANEVAAGFKQAQELLGQIAGPNVHVRILTDLSGPFNTIVQEIEVESLAEWERLRTKIFSDPRFQEGQANASAMIESGRTEFYTVEA